MRILVLNPILFTPENEQVPKNVTIKDTMIYGMCLGFKQLGHEVTLAAGEEYQPTQKEQYDFEVLWFHNNLLGRATLSLPCSFSLFKYIKKHRKDFDIVLASETFAFHTLWAAMLCPEKTVIWQELSAHQRKLHQLPSKLWHNCVARLLYRKVRCVVGRSERAAHFVSRYLPRVSQEVVDHGIDTSKFVISAQKEPQFITTAQLVERKHIDGIIERFSQLLKVKGYEQYRLLIAGRGPEEQNLRALVAQLGIGHNVQFLGFLDRTTLNHYLSRSVASLVLTSRDLNVVSITESVVSGTPVITNSVPNTAQWVAQNHLGIMNDNWGVPELMEVSQNSEYAHNCVAMHDYLSYKNAARRLIDIFLRYKADNE